MISRIDADEAFSNLGASKTARWSEPDSRVENSISAAQRLDKPIFRPEIQPKFTFTKQIRLFAMGSCFAREIEQALVEQGFSVPFPGHELATRWGHIVKGTNISPWVAGAYANKFNTYTMLYEVQRACLGPDQAPDPVVKITDSHWFDICASNVLTDVSETAVRERRTIILDRHSRNMVDCNVFILVLGLTEGWYNRRLGLHTNDQTGAVSNTTRSDYDFITLDFNDHMVALEELYRIVKQRNPDCRFVVTVSPVPLRATFSGQDIVVSNMYSKSTLRSVAGVFCAQHDDADYFPSYEMVWLSDPEVAWHEDRRHVHRTMVSAIVELFISRYIVDN